MSCGRAGNNGKLLNECSTVIMPARDRRKPSLSQRDPRGKSIIFQPLGGTVAIIGIGFETAVTSAARVHTDGQGQRINDLHPVVGLSAHHRQPLLNGGFDLPQVRGLTYQRGALPQARKPITVMSLK